MFAPASSPRGFPEATSIDSNEDVTVNPPSTSLRPFQESTIHITARTSPEKPSYRAWAEASRPMTNSRFLALSQHCSQNMWLPNGQNVSRNTQKLLFPECDTHHQVGTSLKNKPKQVKDARIRRDPPIWYSRPEASFDRSTVRTTKVNLSRGRKPKGTDKLAQSNDQLCKHKLWQWVDDSEVEKEPKKCQDMERTIREQEARVTKGKQRLEQLRRALDAIDSRRAAEASAQAQKVRKPTARVDRLANILNRQAFMRASDFLIALDRNGDGTVTKEEYFHQILRLGVPLTELDAHATWDFLDADNSGTIDLDEVNQYLRGARQRAKTKARKERRNSQNHIHAKLEAAVMAAEARTASLEDAALAEAVAEEARARCRAAAEGVKEANFGAGLNNGADAQKDVQHEDSVTNVQDDGFDGQEDGIEPMHARFWGMFDAQDAHFRAGAQQRAKSGMGIIYRNRRASRNDEPGSEEMHLGAMELERALMMLSKSYA